MDWRGRASHLRTRPVTGRQPASQPEGVSASWKGISIPTRYNRFPFGAPLSSLFPPALESAKRDDAKLQERRRDMPRAPDW